MEDLVGRHVAEAFRGRSVLVTGHTGFKGSWLTLWLSLVDASVTGYALAPPTTPSLFEAAGVASRCRSLSGDVRDLPRLRDALRRREASVVFHLAAQALVRRAYAEPLETIDTNVTGTACLLEAVRLRDARAQSSSSRPTNATEPRIGRRVPRGRPPRRA